jgi:DNA mismatch repair ATPase MutS
VTPYLKIVELKTTFSGEVGTYFVSYMTKDSLVNKNSLPKTNEVEQQPDSREDTTQRITFFYKLVPGVASQSFGLHVARLAQVSYCLLRIMSTLQQLLSNDMTLKSSGYH